MHTIVRTTAMTAALLAGTALAHATPMSGAFTGHIDSQNAQPLGSAEKLRIEETASGQNASPGSPLDGAQVTMSEVVTLNRGQGPVKGTITFTTPTGTTTSPYTGIVSTDAQGRVTAKGKFKTNAATGAFAGLTGTGSFTVSYTSKTDFTGQWQGNFKVPAPPRP